MRAQIIVKLQNKYSIKLVLTSKKRININQVNLENKILMKERYSNGNLGVFGIPIAIVVVLILFLLTGYVKASPNEAAVISGLSKKPRVLIGRAGFKIPFFEKVDRMNIGQLILKSVLRSVYPQVISLILKLMLLLRLQ